MTFNGFIGECKILKHFLKKIRTEFAHEILEKTKSINKKFPLENMNSIWKIVIFK